MKGYFAFPPPTFSTHPPPLPSNAIESTRASSVWTQNQFDGNHDAGQQEDPGIAVQEMEDERQRIREHERELGERSEIEWVRAGGMLRDAFGKRDKARTERIRQELRVQDMERERMARWDAYEVRWRAMLASTGPITFVEFPWPLAERVSSRDLAAFTRGAVSKFLFESLEVRTNTTTRRERIRSSLLRWHPDKMSIVLGRVVLDDLELVREGIHAMFSILKTLQDAERTGTL